ncbi:MAG: deoxyguanosinetriphosphate triphosphohydrolase [Lachnospiraceae bacterium]|nr:deoxyguanosinetriphosphate triphosphohydrolase [Lachnospiraceae bacterium]MCR5411326.1 deoxyguanosinetriphosphate triphosphohydrolase [Lachnospiraceae bacterium]
MTIRESIEEIEKQTLSPYAALSSNSKGRARKESEDDLRPVFQRDRDRILHSKSFRRLKDKTQVFLIPAGDHYRTRLIHTLEVSQNARTIAKALRLNEDLVEAIALGHDLGHTPFGHAGERALNRVCSLGFEHSEQSLRVVDVLEKDMNGLNLTFEVRDGIRNHRTSGDPKTLEGKIVQISDKIAYMHHDMDDAIRAGILKNDSVPDHIGNIAGFKTVERLDYFIHDVITESIGRNDICMSEPATKAMKDLRDWMFKSVYTNPKAKSEEGKAESLIESLYMYFYNRPDRLPMEYRKLMAKTKDPLERIVCDYISSMTDRYAIGIYSDLFIPTSWSIK